MPTVLLADYAKLDPETFRRVLGPDYDVQVRELDTEAALVDAVREIGADAVITEPGTPVSRATIDTLSLRVVARPAIGVNGIDLDAAAAAGVTVLNCAEYCTDEVATHALALLLDCVRSISAYDRSVVQGEWSWEATRELHRLRDRTIGLLAFGPIARRFAELVSGFDCPILAYDPYIDDETMAAYGVEAVDFDELCDKADVLSVHAPLTGETRGMVDAAALSRLGPGAIVVNTGRGAVVDEDALVRALDDGTVAAAGLDVLAVEPPEDSPLVGHDDTTVTPHAGWYSAEARATVNETIATDVKRVFDGQRPKNDVQKLWF
ncbi:C-terminal binding protein [Haloarchaeobius sp. DFWS5]|uniref:C-terminal binding protein n=1 Tax=Haloarchaeobius sp. DFWS5 TaxID=3446114 RepID=UPI003EBEE0DC